jgi:GNAT superfamily N-acetyltransferase
MSVDGCLEAVRRRPRRHVTSAGSGGQKLVDRKKDLGLVWSEAMDLASLGYRTDLALLRLGGTSVEDRGDHLVVRSPHNPTYWWGNFLLVDRVASHELSQRWLDRFSAAFPGAEHVALGFDGTDGTVDDLTWFAGRGFTTEVQTVMTATGVHKPARRNTDAIYRRLHSDDDWSQSVELRMRCHEPPPEPAAYRIFITARSQTHRLLVEAGYGEWFGAFIDGQLVSQMGLFSVERELARFQSVETDPGHRRKGLAGSLLYHPSRYGFETLRAKTLVMVADPDYFALDLYRAVGFVATEAQLQIELAASAEPPESEKMNG